MSDIIDLFPSSDDTGRQTSVGQKILFTFLVAGIGAGVMAVVFFGLMPYLIKPEIPAGITSNKDVTSVLGLDQGQSTDPNIDKMTQLSQQQLQTVVDTLRQMQVELAAADSVIGYSIQQAGLQGEFFAQAQVGDVFLVFQPSKQVLLYRPSSQQLIQSGTIGQ